MKKLLNICALLSMLFNTNVCEASSSETDVPNLQVSATRESRSSEVRSRSDSCGSDGSNRRRRSPKRTYDVRPRRNTKAVRPNFKK